MHNGEVRLLFLLTLFFYTFYTILSLVSYRYLYADGSYFLLKLLESKTFVYAVWSRAMAEWATQIPIVLGMHLGISNVNVLGGLFGLGLFFPPIISLVVTYTFLPYENKEKFIFPLLSFLFLFMNTTFFNISKSVMAASLFWILFVYAHRGERGKLWERFLIAICALLSIRCYESFLFFSPLLLYCYAKMFRRVGWSGEAYVVVTSLTLSLGVSLYGVAFPPSTIQRTDFILGAVRVLSSAPFWTSLVAVGLVLSLTRGLRQVKLISFFVVMLSVLLAIWPLLFPVVAPSLHYDARFLNLLVPLVLALFYVMNHQKIFPQKAIVLSTKILLTSFFIHQLLVLNLWQNYVSQFQFELERKNGRVLYRDSILSQKKSLRSFNWSWTMPTMSLLLQKLKQSKGETLILNPEQE